MDLDGYRLALARIVGAELREGELVRAPGEDGLGLPKAEPLSPARARDREQLYEDLYAELEREAIGMAGGG